MKTSREIRAEAWQLLWKGGGIVRLGGAGLALGIVLFGVTAVLAYAYRVLDISTLQDYVAAKQQAASQGLGYTASSDGAMMRINALCGNAGEARMYATAYNADILRCTRGRLTSGMRKYIEVDVEDVLARMSTTTSTNQTTQTVG